MKNKFFSILLAGALLIGTACISTNAFAGPTSSDPCLNSNDGYHHYTARYTLIVKTTEDNKNHYMQAFKCSCGSMIATTGFPTDPYGSVGNYMTLDSDRINSAPGASTYTCYSIPGRDEYFNKNYTGSWHFTHTGMQ